MPLHSPGFDTIFIDWRRQRTAARGRWRSDLQPVGPVRHTVVGRIIDKATFRSLDNCAQYWQHGDSFC